MGWLLAGIIAALICWGIDSWFTDRGGVWKLIIMVPVLEEGAKTGLALLLGANIVLVHAVFGTIEAIYEIYRDRKMGSGAAALLIHFFLGIITTILFACFHSWSIALLGAIILHSGWNTIIIHFFMYQGGE